jgi:glycosyltransferase involved in cell wall biosynthesis
MFHLRKFGQQIMSAANEVLFVTPTYRKLLAEQYLTAVLGKQILNATVIPNGLTSDWLSNAELRNKPHTPLKLLYVGDFTSNKNIIHLLQVVRKLSNEMAVTLTLVGGGGDGHMEVERTLQQQGFEFAQYLGKVEGINAIKTLYRKHDIFIMISKLETFGLVYLEALSQGLPIIHTAGQGIDGYFDNSSFAIPVKSNGMEEIITAIKKLAFSYETASRQAVEAAQPFSWEQIADRYTNLYFEKLNK